MEDISHFRENFSPEDADEYFQRLRDEVPWREMEWSRGKNLPRLIFQYDQGLIPALEELKLLCEETFECKIQGIWCNYYRSGKDWTPPHQDRYQAHVFTYSFGGSRKCVTEEISTGKKTNFMLNAGDIFYFSPEWDALHKHSIPKSLAKNVTPRISVVMFTTKPFAKKSGESEKYLDMFQWDNPDWLATSQGQGPQIVVLDPNITISDLLKYFFK